jgi:hypothetical protein
MFNELSEQLQAHGYWFHTRETQRMQPQLICRVIPDNTFILNTEEPSTAPANKDFEPGRGVIMTVQVLKYQLLVRWAMDDAGYDETWEFQTVAEFMKFYDKFMTDGIDEMMDYANEMAKGDN